MLTLPTSTGLPELLKFVKGQNKSIVSFSYNHRCLYGKYNSKDASNSLDNDISSS